MSRPDERDIIRTIHGVLGNAKFTPEDAETFATDGRLTVVAVDTLVQSTDMPPNMRLRDAARKSIAACVSDFASKGARPLFGIISLNLPKVTAPQVRQIALGLRQASDEFGIRILGGDTNSGREFVFHACIFGEAEGIIPRNGARHDDLIFTSGAFGYAAAGLEMLKNGMRASPGFRRAAMESFARPQPRLDFALKCRKYLTSSMDSSDGLSATLNEMARQSRTKFVIHGMPTDGRLEEFARLNGLSPERLVFHGGEEYEIVFTAPEIHRHAILDVARSTRTRLFEIGRVRKGRSSVFVEKNGTTERLHDLGWRHFKR